MAFKVLAEKRVPLIAVRQLIERGLHSRIRAKMERALGLSLRDKYASGTAKDHPSRKFDSSSVGPDSARISDLYFAAARQNGIDKEPELQAKLSTIAEDLLLSYYLEQIDISPAAARSYFARHPDQFPAYEAITITEIVVHNRKLAQDLRLAIARGVDPELLVPIFSQGVGASGGRVKLSPYTMPSMRYERAKGMEINAVGGPMEWAGKFSVFVVVDKVRAGGQWDRASQRRAERLAREEKERRHLDALRQKFSVRVLAER